MLGIEVLESGAELARQLQRHPGAPFKTQQDTIGIQDGPEGLTGRRAHPQLLTHDYSATATAHSALCPPRVRVDGTISKEPEALKEDPVQAEVRHVKAQPLVLISDTHTKDDARPEEAARGNAIAQAISGDAAERVEGVPNCRSASASTNNENRCDHKRWEKPRTHASRPRSWC